MESTDHFCWLVVVVHPPCVVLGSWCWGLPLVLTAVEITSWVSCGAHLDFFCWLPWASTSVEPLMTIFPLHSRVANPHCTVLVVSLQRWALHPNLLNILNQLLASVGGEELGFLSISPVPCVEMAAGWATLRLSYELDP